MTTLQPIDPNKSGMKQKITQFCNDTSFLPISQAYKTDSWYKCICIVLMSMGMSGFMVYQITTLVIKYYDYPIQVHIELTSSNEQPFPSITICNLNPIRRDAIQGSELFSQLETMRDDGRGDMLYKAAEQNYNSHHANTDNQITQSSSAVQSAGTSGAGTSTVQSGSQTDTHNEEVDTTVSVSTNPPPAAVKRRKREDDVTPDPTKFNEFLSSESYNQWTNGLATVGNSFYHKLSGENKAFNDIMDKIDPHRLAGYSQRLEDFLLSCRFQGFSCSPRNFTWIDNYKYGKCWTFNPIQKNGVSLEPLVTRNTGPLHGVVLELFIDQDSYIPSLSPQAGARVLIHTRGEMPFPEEAGFTISPGATTSVGMRKTHVIRLPAPHGKCLNTSTATLYSSRYNITYSKPACERSCLQEKIISSCECAFAKYVVPHDPKPEVCKTKDALHCARDLEQRFRKNELDCDKSCPLPCNVFRYDKTISSSSWPSEKYKPDIVERISRVSSKMTQMNKRIEVDVAKLEVYFTELDYVKIEQKEAYGFEDLVSDLGGQLGLYMGISLLAVAEIIGLLMVICHDGAKRAYVIYRPHPASVFRYDKTISSSSWPSEKYKPDIVERISRVSSKMTQMNKRIEVDVAKLEVYFTELDYVKIEQKEAYGFEDLVSDLGGQLGLYMGISLLAVAEIIGLLMVICHDGVKHAYVIYRPHPVRSPKTVRIAPDHVGAPPVYKSPDNTVNL